MTTQLTLHYTLCSAVLLTIAGALLYWALTRSLDRQNQVFVAHKLQVLALILAKRPLDMPGLQQEVYDEAQISERSRSAYLLRVLDGTGRLVAETPGMGRSLPAAIFPSPPRTSVQLRKWHSGGHVLLLAAAAAGVPTEGVWHLQAALDIDSGEALLARYRRDVAVLLLAGVAVAAALGAWISRRGLRPLAAITGTVQRISAQRLEQRLQPGGWPRELATLASEFDRMLERLQDSFERLSQFSADLAHELRTPIHNLMGETQVALSQERTNAEYLEVLHSALEEQGRLARMIDSMLFLAQADQARLLIAPRLLDARCELAAMVELYQALADERGVQLRCEDGPPLQADPQLLRRALSNLVSNALKWTPRGGTVLLRATGGDADRAGVALSVIDSGIGIAAEHVSRLADRFYRVDPARADVDGGVGLGLSIVRSIMALHGGALRIDSAPGIGTTATLLFPAAVSTPAVVPSVRDDNPVMLDASVAPSI
jgi:two-component system, OmpR family, heavy metal sensor histidine kinase CusS